MGKIARGGSFNNNQNYIHCTRCRRRNFGNGYYNQGFRVTKRSIHVLHGGSFVNGQYYAHPVFRGPFDSNFCLIDTGFRAVKDIEVGI